MPIQPGQPIPSAKIKLATPEGPKDIDPSEYLAGKRVVMFTLPGAFTPTCSKHHLPGYVARAAELKAKGVDLIACLSVNDGFVMQAWAEANGVGDKIAMLADGNGEWSIKLGIEADLTGPIMGLRCRRGVLTINNGVVESIELEAPGKFEVSSADACQARL